MTARDIDVAALIYARLGWVDSWRLQKLAYYGQAWSLAWTGRPLFASPIQAWRDGPVAPELHRVNKYDTPTMSTAIPGAEASRIGEDGVRVMDAVLEFYARFDKAALVQQTHSERPWVEAYQRGQNTEITQDSMLRFYSMLSSIGGAVPTRSIEPVKPASRADFLLAAEVETARWPQTLEILAR